MGEAATAVPLVEAITRRWPQLGIVMTTVTPTGARIVADRLAGRDVTWHGGAIDAGYDVSGATRSGWYVMESRS